MATELVRATDVYGVSRGLPLNTSRDHRLTGDGAISPLAGVRRRPSAGPDIDLRADLGQVGHQLRASPRESRCSP